MTFDDAALQLLTDYPWPGNVRELENAIEHAFIHCRGEVILARCLPPHLQPSASPPPTHVEAQAPTVTDERASVLRALEKSQWNRNEAARQLGMHRTTLWRKMREFGL